MEFLVEFEVNVPAGAAAAEVEQRQRSQADAAADLARQGHLVRLWTRRVESSRTSVVGLYRAETEAQLDELLSALPLGEWMRVTVTPLMAHPNDPGSGRAEGFGLPDPRLTPVYRLEATLAPPFDLGDTEHGHRRIVPLTGGTFTGPELNGTLVAGVSADWQTVLPDGTALGDIRYTLQTDGGAVLAVRSDGVRHGPPDVLARLARGEDVDAAEYTFRTSTRIETAVPDLDWLNRGIFVSVGGRLPGRVVYETYLVG
jgi:muconolactone delta-isomerase